MSDTDHQTPKAAKDYLPFIPIWLDESKLSPRAFRVVCHLWRRAGKKQTCYPSAKTISLHTGLDRKTVFRALAELERRGLLVRLERKEDEKRHHNVNRYHLPLGSKTELVTSAENDPSTSAENDPSSRVKNGTPLGSKTGHKGITSKGHQGKDTKEGLSEGPPVDDLEIFEAYPKQVGKAAALKAIAEARKTVPGYKLLNAVMAYAEAVEDWDEEDRRFIPHPATWFNKGHYDDDPEVWVRTSGTNHHWAAPTAEDHTKGF